MPSVVRRKKQKSEDQVLDEATARLLRGIKEHEKKIGKVVTSDQMRTQGYSERFIAKMEQA
jgi:predicted GNAT family N-acyltransferase